MSYKHVNFVNIYKFYLKKFSVLCILNEVNLNIYLYLQAIGQCCKHINISISHMKLHHVWQRTQEMKGVTY